LLLGKRLIHAFLEIALVIVSQSTKGGLDLHLACVALTVQNYGVDTFSTERPPMTNEAVISVLSIPRIPYFPELRKASLTAGHSTLHDIE